ncbi:hypothetical protein [Deinococcus aquaticus]|uniref:Uncharacterized protein n=1 Tax=Deinococcus aquaticus TaxID=328692 RepID=A0ABY7V0I7_9DEIO|nr:hypothetical protein [Deinococcus aquaticus]WDA58149.1 hypothetical protein M8445_12435 [Deinococcus aquaticus]
MTLPELIPLVQPAAEAAKTSTSLFNWSLIISNILGASIALMGVFATAKVSERNKDKELERQKEENLVKRKHDSAKEYLISLGKVSSSIKEIDHRLLAFSAIIRYAIGTIHHEIPAHDIERLNNKIALFNDLISEYKSSNAIDDVESQFEETIRLIDMELNSMIYLAEDNSDFQTKLDAIEALVISTRNRHKQMAHQTRMLYFYMSRDDYRDKLFKRLQELVGEYYVFEKDMQEINTKINQLRRDALESTKKQIS